MRTTGGSGGPATSVIAKVKRRQAPESLSVLILNDDYTPMEFVVHVLEKFFQKDVEAATKIMLTFTTTESGVRNFTYEIPRRR